jgi:glycosyltransferase involved in cell wall biosynthesis
MTVREPQQSAAGSLAITAVMPAFNCRAFLERTLPPLLEMRNRGDIQEVIVVDDGSLDGTGATAEALGAWVIPSGGHRRGPGAARNEAAKQAHGDVLWFIDSDVIAKCDGPSYIRCALADPGVVAVFGSYDDRPAAINMLSQYKNLVHHYYHQISRGDASTFWAGCGAVRKDGFMAVGGFDVVRFPKPSIEDIELGYRLRARGGRIVLCPNFQGTHLKEWRLRNLIETEIFQRALPWSRLLLTGAGGLGSLNVSMPERLRALTACAWAFALVLAFAGLASWSLPVWILATAFAANLDLFALLSRRNGIWFGFLGILFHQLYYLYSTAAWAWSWAEAKLIGHSRQRGSVAKTRGNEVKELER